MATKQPSRGEGSVDGVRRYLISGPQGEQLAIQGSELLGA